MLRDGSMAWEVKDFLVAQERCVDVTVEGQVFPGKAAKKDDDKYKQQNEVNTKKKSKKKTESKKADLEGNRASHLKQELWWNNTKGEESQGPLLLALDMITLLTICEQWTREGCRPTWGWDGSESVLWVNS